MSSQSASATSSATLEDRQIYGFGPEHRMPYSCSYCLGTPRLVKECRPCNGTGLMWDSSSSSMYGGKDERQIAPGGSSQGSSSVSSYGQRG
ncbi:hypothetical protein F4781DRAFT_205051 [Annulohypoxylon bovei var. microspora]|nr:hypothetical protein F4781DRAFT_205051 [Annulohypoxylon bovei var. microspora]